MRICVFCFDAYGDMVLREPLFRALLAQGHAVAAVTRGEYSAILPYLSPDIDVIAASVFAQFRDAWQPGAWTAKLAELEAQVKAWQPDCLVIAEASLCTSPSASEFRDFFLRFTAIPRIGMTFSEQPKKAEELGYSQVVKVGALSHECSKYQKLLAGWLKLNDILPQPRLTMSGRPTDGARQILQELGLRSKSYAIACPAGATAITNKGVPPMLAAPMAAHLYNAYGLQTLFVGVENERPQLDAITTILNEHQIPFRQWLGDRDSFPTLMGLLDGAALYTGCDTGPMHICAALDIPVLAIFGGGTYPRFVPTTDRSVSLTQKMPCSPCAWQCPYPAPPPCIAMVRIQDTIRGIDQLMTGQVTTAVKHTGAYEIGWKR